jgi:hypothetical protein
MLSLNFALLPPVSAPPAYVPYTTGFVSYSTWGIEVPETRSNISITSEEISTSNYTHSVAFRGELQLKNTGDPNCSIVVAYPNRWRLGPPVHVVEYLVSYRIESDQVNYNAYTFGSQDNNTTLPEGLAWLSSHQFEAINITLDESAEVVLEITAYVQIAVSADYLHFRYGIDDGLTRMSSTHSVVRIEIHDTAKFYDCTFAPTETLSVTQSNGLRTGTWDFEVTDFNEDYVEVALQQGIYEPPRADDIVFLMTSIGLLTLLAIVLLCRKRSREGSTP